MHLHKTSQSRLVAELTQEDLYGYKVSFEEMRMENEQTVQLLHDILLRAKAKLGWDDFLDLLLFLKAGRFPPSSYTFLKDDMRFFGIFRFQSVLETRKAAKTLSEFGTLCRATPEAVAYLREHLEPITLRQGF